ncbi:hypothetical protein BGW36DRAFT_411393 [Talaromyces proteolyticus]|uniref:Uncharacterized protein n=1 Tax=Talaromyces proteolyticus TaxID=1131652 RepID=A0AAD4KGE5_9EURO|nr:uncharacterized protein BGW36DRAFT_411393 [Talaromyces proteolyticus]KAH8690560.1 hypothetical protein BGW36DRAFT_411393 [Talaromyces proteolyticus]
MDTPRHEAGQHPRNNTYYGVSGIQISIEGIRTDDTEGTVSGIWNAILGCQFSPTENYIIRPEEKNQSGFADLHTIQYKPQPNSTHRECHFLITQCKRRSGKTQQSIWSTARDELAKYFRSSKSRSHGHQMYGIVAVGRKVQFVEFDRKSDSLKDIQIPIGTGRGAIQHVERGSKFWVDRECQKVQRFLDYIKARP